MIKIKKQGSVLIRNIFFISIIFVLTISLLRFQNSNLKSINNAIKSKKIFNQLNIIKNELYFNKQYIYIGDGVYIDQGNVDIEKYKELREVFENIYDDDGDYFYLSFGDSNNEINIRYFSNNNLLFKYNFEI